MPYVGKKPADIIATSVDTDTGTFSGNVTAGGTLGVTGAVTANAGVVVDNITIDGTEIDLSSGDLTIDVAGDIILDADGEDIRLKDGGTEWGVLSNPNGDFGIQAKTQDKDVVFYGNDGGSTTELLRLDASAAGEAKFNDNIVMGTANKGIHLGVTSATASNLLDDYEEGTFTATAANSVTFHTGTAQQQLAYTKIGRQVHVAGSLQINNSNGGSALTVNNLPFTSMNNANIYYTTTTIRFYQYNVPIEADGGDSDTINFVGRVDPNSTTLHFMQSRDNDNTIVLPAQSGAYIIFGITYFAA